MAEQFSGKISVSLDDLRTNATININKLGHMIQNYKDDMPDWAFDGIAKAFDAVAQDIDSLNCIYSDQFENFNDLSNEASIMRLQDEDE